MPVMLLAVKIRQGRNKGAHLLAIIMITLYEAEPAGVGGGLSPSSASSA
jgi:hypothetical protein